MTPIARFKTEPYDAQDVPPELSMFATDARGAAPWVAAVLRTSEGAAPLQLLGRLQEAAGAVLPLDRVVAAEEAPPPPPVLPSAAGNQLQVATLQRSKSV